MSKNSVPLAFTCEKSRGGKLRIADIGAVVLSIAAIFVYHPSVTYADALRTITRVVNEAAGIADDIPLRGVDDVTKSARREALVREIVESRSGRKIAETADELRHMDALWRNLLGPKQVTLLDDIKKLSVPEQRLAYALASGGRRIKEVVPDVALRGRLIREGGSEMLLTVGRYPDLADDVLRFHTALRGGKLPAPPGARALTTADFGKFFETTGQRGYHFWNKYVRPHWKLWLGSSALAAIMLAPDEYLDALGDLTEEGIRRIAAFITETLLAAIRGAARGTVEGSGQGLKKMVESLAQSFYATFLTSWAGPVVLVCLLGLLIFTISSTKRLISNCWQAISHLVWRKTVPRRKL